jgi:GNAT superfamily N-acetyltransferase
VVAEADGAVVGFAQAVPSRDDPPVRPLELASLYLRAALHGSGLGQALLDAAVGDRPASLWVAEVNPRARRFYERNGFVPDGARQVLGAWEGLIEVRLVR